MGKFFIDQYSLLHLAVGIIAYFWNISLVTSFLAHFLFELGENTKMGMNIINTYFTKGSILHWPGGKPHTDARINIVGDNIFFVFGWILARAVDLYGSSKGYYTIHIE